MSTAAPIAPVETTTRPTEAEGRGSREDVYTRVTNRIVEDLERGVRPWLKPWNAENAAGRITRPLRHSGQPYQGINILMLWASAEQQGFACPRSKIRIVSPGVSRLISFEEANELYLWTPM